MNDVKQLIARDLLSIKAVFFRPDEPFTWASGIKSPVYCDNRLTLTAPEVRCHVEESLAKTIKEHYPEVTKHFLDKLSDFTYDLQHHREWFELQKNTAYPDKASSFAFRIGMARYKEKDEQKAAEYEKTYAGKEKNIDFSVVNSQALYEIGQVIRQLQAVLQ